MITVKNIQSLSGPLAEYVFPSTDNHLIDGQNRLLMLPAWIDTDLSLGKLTATSDAEWKKLALEILATGASTIINNSGIAPHAAKQLQEHTYNLFRDANIPLHIHYTFDGTDPTLINEAGKNKQSAIAIDLPVQILEKKQEAVANKLFQVAAQENLILLVSLSNYADSSAALEGIKKTLEFAEKYKTEISFQQVRTQEELALIAQAKASEMLIFAAVAYSHLFFTDEALKKKHLDLGNTFLPTEKDQEALWKAINDGTIDSLGSGSQLSPSGRHLSNGRLMLPFMLDACRHEKISYEQLIALIRITPERIYRLPPTKDVVLVDMETQRPLPIDDSLLSLWSGRPLTGWPTHVISKGQVFTF